MIAMINFFNMIICYLIIYILYCELFFDRQRYTYYLEYPNFASTSLLTSALGDAKMISVDEARSITMV